MLGRLRWSERDYYCSSPKAFYLACKGYFNERAEEERWARNIAFVTYRIMGGKASRPGKIWPMRDDEEDDTFAPLTADQMEQLNKLRKVYK